MAKDKTTAVERFAALLKHGSSDPEINDFREQARDVFRVGGAAGLACWIEARRDLELLNDPAVAKAAKGLQLAAARAIIEDIGLLPESRKPRRSWEEQLALINERERKRRENLPPVGYRGTSKPKPKPKPKPNPRPKPRVQRQRPLSPTTTPAPKPMSLLERMAAAWGRLISGDRYVD